MVKRWLLGLSALALAGCSTPAQEEQPVAATGAGSPVPPAAVSVADPCADGPAGCTPVGRVDIDGDGVLDQVGMAVAQQEMANIGSPPATVTVRVATVGGVRQYVADFPTVTPRPDMPAGMVVGAFSFSRPRGADLVLHPTEGQGNADQFLVIGWHNNELVPVPPPPSASRTTDASPVWYLTESHGRQQSVTCQSGGTITLNNQTAPVQEGIPVPGGGIMESDRWTFADGAWSPQGSENTASHDFSYKFDAHTDAFACENQIRR